MPRREEPTIVCEAFPREKGALVRLPDYRHVLIPFCRVRARPAVTLPRFEG